MSYIQLNPDGTFLREVFGGVRPWDENNYCSVDALVADGKAAQFRVVPLTVTQPPAIDPVTQSVMRDGCEKVDGEWQYKWRIDALTAEEITAKAAALATAQAEAAAQAKLATHAAAAKADAKLAALGDMSPAQVRAWVAANVTNLADAKDVLATLAIAVSIISRKI